MKEFSFCPKLLALPALLLIAPAGFALDQDRKEPIHIQADAAVIDEKSGVSTYTGNVTVNQGSLRIAADEVRIHSIEKEVTEIVATSIDGSDHLAHYEQLPEESDLIVAVARTITYFVKDERLRLVGDAQLNQTEKKSFAGEVINYEAQNGLVKAESNGVGRVETIFIPGKK